MAKYNTWEELKKTKELLKGWVSKDELLPDEAIDWAQDFGNLLANRDLKVKEAVMTTSQLRKFFDALKTLKIKLQTNEGVPNFSGLFLLRAKLAYATARAKEKNNNFDTRMNWFYEMFSEVMRNSVVKTKKHFNNFIDLLEAVVAYHKYHGGK